jgi:hypothetical protein
MRIDPAAFDRLDKIIESWSMMNKPKVKVALSPWGRYWRVTIEEEQIEGEPAYHGSSDLDMHVDWAHEQLKTWTNVSRQSWQDWRFMKRSDAEKFITLHTLVWAQ